MKLAKRSENNVHVPKTGLFCFWFFWSFIYWFFFQIGLNTLTECSWMFYFRAAFLIERIHLSITISTCCLSVSNLVSSSFKNCLSANHSSFHNKNEFQNFQTAAIRSELLCRNRKLHLPKPVSFWNSPSSENTHLFLLALTDLIPLL